MTMLTTSDIDPYLDVEDAIKTLKNSMNAVILSHYYQTKEIQEIADFCGDSLQLSQFAKTTNSDVIVFCGVKFMAESACIINPDKQVLIPDLNAGCSLESSCPPKKFKEFREKYPNHVSVTYINSSSEVKALSDIIVTSSNAEQIINSIPKDREILFAPDKHLGNYLMRKTNRQMILWDGTCIVHINFSERELINTKAKHPNAKIIAHPECPSHLLKYAEHIGSTSSLLNYTQEHNESEFIVLTEPSVIHQMKKFSPKSKFYDIPSIDQAGCTHCNYCPYMQLNSIEKLYLCMVNRSPELKVDPHIAARAKLSLDRMLTGKYTEII